MIVVVNHRGRVLALQRFWAWSGVNSGAEHGAELD